MAMKIPDPCSTEGLAFLQGHLESRSYITGHAASQNDVKVFAAMKCEPHDSERFVDVVRWYRHIKSHGAEERKGLPQAQHEVNVLRDPQRVKKEEEVGLRIFSLVVALDLKYSSCSFGTPQSHSSSVITKHSFNLQSWPCDQPHLHCQLFCSQLWFPCLIMYARM